jgi:hypothetical protein
VSCVCSSSRLLRVVPARSASASTVNFQASLIPHYPPFSGLLTYRQSHKLVVNNSPFYGSSPRFRFKNQYRPTSSNGLTYPSVPPTNQTTRSFPLSRFASRVARTSSHLPPKRPAINVRIYPLSPQTGF